MKILVLGRSYHLYAAICHAFKSDEIEVVQWRGNCSCSNFSNLKYDIIFIVGFDYSSYMKDYEEYMQVNIKNPLLNLISLCKNNTDIVYISTQYSNLSYTFSRYRYAKEELGSKIVEQFPNSYIVRFDTFVNSNGELKVNANFIIKKIFYFLIKINIIKTINLKDVSIKLGNYKKSYSLEVNRIEGLFIRAPRTQFIDRLLRVMFG